MSTFSKRFLRNRSKAPDRFRQARHGTSTSDGGLSEYARILASLCEKMLRLTAMRGLIALLKRYARSLDENLISFENATADVLRQTLQSKELASCLASSRLLCNSFNF
jgi:hypothetical protein